MQKIRLMALGGLDEDGKNMYVIEIDKDIFVVEAGLKYPNENEQLGVEYIIPDFTYLIENKDRIRGIFITHGHDDVMAALSHLLKEINVDVYTTALTAKIIEDDLGKHYNKLHVISRDATLQINDHIIHAFPVKQSIADSFGLAFETANGSIVYTSEFIVDYDFSNPAFAMDINMLSHLSLDNVLVMMTESVGATKNGYTTPKHRITDLVEPYFEDAQDRIIISLYRQNLFRIIEVLDLAKKYNRKVFFYDKEHVRLLKMVEDLGYYKCPANTVISAKDFNNDIKDIICVVSGSGNKVFRLMNKIAVGEDDVLELKQDDTVIIASPIVPGTEKEASTMENDLYKANVKVIKLNPKELLSMHASIEDLKMMLSIVNPKYYFPVKGEYAQLIANADVAIEMGYTPDKIIILDNGQFAIFENGKLTSTHDMLELNDTLIDASDRNDVSSMVLRDREALSTDGVIVAGVVVDFKTKEVIGGPDVQSRGVIYLKDADHILNEIGNIIIDSIRQAVKENRYDNMQVRIEAREKINRYITKETGKKPMILPAIVEIDLGENNA